MGEFLNKIKSVFIPQAPQHEPKKYFHGVSAIRSVPFQECEEKLIMSGFVPDMIIWLQQHQTADGWININIVPKKEKTEARTHVAYLNERMTKKNESTDKA